MLKDEPLEYIREQYDEKNMVLEGHGEEVDPWSFYEDVFGDLEREVPVVIIDEDEEKRIRSMTVEDAIEFGSLRNDTLLGGCTYYNNWISKKSAKDLYTLIIDYDNAYSGVLLNALQNDWKSANGEQFAKPTYIVNSGTGLHLYFVMKEPIPIYDHVKKNLDNLYRTLAAQQSRRVYVEKQIQWFGQDFRIAGGLNKYEWKNTVFKVGDKWDIDELSKAVGLDLHFSRYGDPKPEKKRKGKKRHHRNRSCHVYGKDPSRFYEYSLQNCREKTKEGNRYLSMCALSVIAYKCNILPEKLERDLESLLPAYNKGAIRQIKPKEIKSAIKMYCPKAIMTPRESLERWQGWKYDPIRRNHQKQRDHLEEARAIRDIRQRRKGTKWTDGNGRPSKEDTVRKWRAEHPDGKKAECIRDTGLSKPTVYRHWNS